MDPSVARSIAHAGHWQRRDDDGRLVTEHVERVAAAVAPEARTVAYLHEIPQRTDVSHEELRASGLTAIEAEALTLLTRAGQESFELFVLRIAHAPGEAGRLARAVQLADLDDHLARGDRRLPRPPYAWGARHLVVSMDRRGERVRRAAGSVASAGGRLRLATEQAT